MTHPSPTWIKQIKQLAQAEMIPQWGHSFHIDFPFFSTELAKAFSLSSLEIAKTAADWIEPAQQLVSLSSKFSLIRLELSPIQGECYLAISQEDKKKWISMLLGTSETHKNFTDQRLEEGYLIFSILRVLRIIDQSGIFPGCTLHLADEKPLPKTTSFCIDFSLRHKESSCTFRLICPKEFTLEFRNYFLTQKLPERFKSDIAIAVSCFVGSSNLTLTELQSLEVGDMLVLDRCSYDPDNGKGHVEMCVAGKTILQARLKPDGLKVIDFNDFFEDEPMSDDEALPEEENLSLEGEEVKETAPEKPKKTKSAKETLTSLSHLPITVHVEIAKFPITLEKLLQLSSGNVLDLAIQPEMGVNLVVNGKTMAKGEIVKVGDVLGVKILEIGAS